MDNKLFNNLICNKLKETVVYCVFRVKYTQQNIFVFMNINLVCTRLKKRMYSCYLIHTKTMSRKYMIIWYNTYPVSILAHHFMQTIYHVSYVITYIRTKQRTYSSYGLKIYTRLNGSYKKRNSKNISYMCIVH